jgi:hypothetical protein
MYAAMSSAQHHLAEMIDTFYGASDKTSDSAMAAHAYKCSVEELDTGIGRKLVRGDSFTTSQPTHTLFFETGRPLSHDHP